MPHTEGPRASLARSALDPQSVLYGIDEGTQALLAELGELVDADALLTTWTTASSELARGDVLDHDVFAAALRVRDALADVAAMLPPSEDRLSAPLRAADHEFWQATQDDGAAGPPPSEDWGGRPWWRSRAVRGTERTTVAVADGTAAAVPGPSPRPGQLCRILQMRSWASDLAAAQRKLEDADYRMDRARAPQADDVVAALRFVLELTRRATPRLHAADLDLKAARPLAIEHLERLLAGAPGPHADDLRGWWRAESPLRLARMLAWERDVRDTVPSWAREPQSLLHGADDATIARVVDLALSSEGLPRSFDACRVGGPGARRGRRPRHR
ncbi:MAG: hypothetical protein J7513_12055 [Solirubrobacteraceae bacterium]|nr:hypothetical protein [Solirubrobacteraceae bacterium]